MTCILQGFFLSTGCKTDGAKMPKSLENSGHNEVNRAGNLRNGYCVEMGVMYMKCGNCIVDML